jgi:coenzyme Q-binding protein COQ10
MFDLVADIESYPGFLPLCLGTRILRRSPSEAPNVEVVVAEMRIGYKAVRETFTSRVRLDRPRLEIDVDYVDGPFRKMQNRWRFLDEPSGGGAAGSRVEFFIDYEFRTRGFAMLMGVVFDAAFRKFAQAFEERADALYRRPPGAARASDPPGIGRPVSSPDDGEDRPSMPVAPPTDSGA